MPSLVPRAVRGVPSFGPRTLAVSSFLVAVAMWPTSASRAVPVPVDRLVEMPYGISQAHPYPTHRGHARRHGRSSFRAPAKAPQRRWSADTGSRHLTAPAVAADGRLYVGAITGVIALDARGRRLWHRRLGRVEQTPSILPSGGLLVLDAAGRLHVLDRDGQARRIAEARVWSGLPLVWPDGRVWVAAREGGVFVVEPTTGEARSISSHSSGPLELARLGGRRALAGGLGGKLGIVAAASEDGRWLELGARILFPPAVAEDGSAWLATHEGELSVVATRPSLRIRTRIANAHLTGAPAVARDGTMCAGVRAHTLRCYERDGRLRWQMAAHASFGPVSLDAEGVVLSVTDRGALYAVEADGRLRWRVEVPVARANEPVLGPNRTLYLTGRSGRVEAWR